MNQGLLRRLGDFRVFAAGEFAAIYGVRTGGVYHARSGQFVEMESFTVSRMSKFEAHGACDSDLYWFMRSSQGDWTHQRVDLKAIFESGDGAPFLHQSGTGLTVGK